MDQQVAHDSQKQWMELKKGKGTEQQVSGFTMPSNKLTRDMPETCRVTSQGKG